MCGRYYIDNDIFQIVKLQFRDDSDIECDEGDCFPSQQILIIYQEETQLKMTKKSWGYTHSKYQGRIINARCETLFEKVKFKEDIYTNRCLIPAKGFYEWDSLKQQFSFENNNEPLYFAGLFHGDEVVIITTQANQIMRPIHHRMPLIIKQKDIYSWLCCDQEAFSLLNDKNECLEIISGLYQQSLFD